MMMVVVVTTEQKKHGARKGDAKAINLNMWHESVRA